MATYCTEHKTPAHTDFVASRWQAGQQMWFIQNLRWVMQMARLHFTQESCAACPHNVVKPPVSQYTAHGTKLVATATPWPSGGGVAPSATGTPTAMDWSKAGGAEGCIVAAALGRCRRRRAWTTK
mmetsp:Transcript_73432/g.185491  ORF Transcript_73432/g.185491 Transcript_73432/m.185491 type:complete len:125 (+) Transcript_73432:3-377(+)